MKFLFDLFPVILFFVAFKFAGIYVATAVAIAATFAQVGWLKIRRRKVDTMLWASLAIIVVFGGATLLLQDETFIKWKPTILYWLFVAVLAGGELLLRRNPHWYENREQAVLTVAVPQQIPFGVEQLWAPYRAWWI